MKLRYWHHESNFGDALNPWLFPKLFPKPLEHYLNDETLLLGIGSILGQDVPTQPRKLVFSSGFAYGAIPKIDSKWHFFCVRGPLTAKALELPLNMGICDGALLLKKFYEPANTSSFDATFMPHHETAKQEPRWKDICESSSVHYLDPFSSVEDTIDVIRKSKLMVTESLHGAIVADAMRVPWIPIRTRSYINEFKWHDWSKTHKIEHQFEWLPPVEYTKGPFQGLQKSLYPLRASYCRYRLQKIIKFGERRLSKETISQDLYSQLCEKFDQLLHFSQAG